MMNNRNINAAAEPETISTARRRLEAAVMLRRKREEECSRSCALEECWKGFTNTNVSYVTVNGVSMPVPLG